MANDPQAGSVGGSGLRVHGSLSGFGGNPYAVFGARPRREKAVRSYILRQHRSGRPLAEILLDHRLAAISSRTLLWKVLTSPVTIRALGDDVREGLGSRPPGE